MIEQYDSKQNIFRRTNCYTGTSARNIIVNWCRWNSRYVLYLGVLDGNFELELSTNCALLI